MGSVDSLDLDTIGSRSVDSDPILIPGLDTERPNLPAKRYE